VNNCPVSQLQTETSPLSVASSIPNHWMLLPEPTFALFPFLTFIFSRTHMQKTAVGLRTKSKLEAKYVSPNISRTQAAEIIPGATEWSRLLLSDVVCRELGPIHRCRG